MHRFLTSRSRLLLDTVREAGRNGRQGVSGTSGRGIYRTGVGLAGLTAFLNVWTTVVRDDGNGAGFFMLILAAAVGAFAAGFRAAGMARAMLGVAAMQLLLGLLIATAPSMQSLPGASMRMLVFSGAFAALWLIAAACFQRAGRTGA
jgi:hypothetical protein